MTVDQMKIRLPADLKAFVASQAQRNGSSQNSEVIRAVRERMEREALNAPKSIPHALIAGSANVRLNDRPEEGRAD